LDGLKAHEERSRTVTWAAPERSVWTGQPSAVERLLAIRKREAPKPPLYELLCIDVAEAETGRVTLTLRPDESFTSPMGMVGGGIILTILDTTLAWACDTLVPADLVSVTIELNANFLRPVATDGATLSCEAQCVFSGSRTMVGQAKLRDDAGRLYAIATATFMLIARNAAHAPPPGSATGD
jgi:uncharacterized protein (TIGR00369 family)